MRLTKADNRTHLIEDPGCEASSLTYFVVKLREGVAGEAATPGLVVDESEVLLHTLLTSCNTHISLSPASCVPSAHLYSRLFSRTR